MRRKSPLEVVGSILAAHGVSLDHLGGLANNPALADMVSVLLRQGGLTGSIPRQLAQAILNRHFFGVEAWTTHHQASFSVEQLRQILEFPWGVDILNAPCPFFPGQLIWDTHFAYLGLKSLNGEPLTIAQWLELNQRMFYRSDDEYWYVKQDFAKNATCEFRWYLMLLNTVPGTIGKSYSDKLTMLPKDYEVATAVEEAIKLLLYSMMGHDYPGPMHASHCSDVAADGGQVIVGFHDGHGLDIRSSVEHSASLVRTGLAASRKLPQAV